MNKYEDIIDLPHHISKKRPPMSMADRAAQFSPFAALTGYDETIKENDRYLDEKIDISEEEKEILDRKINMITNIPNKRPSLTITYFKKDYEDYRTEADLTNFLRASKAAKAELTTMQDVLQNSTITIKLDIQDDSNA